MEQSLVTLNRSAFAGLFKEKFLETLHVIPTEEETQYAAAMVARNLAAKIEDSLTPRKIQRVHAEYLANRKSSASSPAKPKPGTSASPSRSAA